MKYCSTLNFGALLEMLRNLKHAQYVTDAPGWFFFLLRFRGQTIWVTCVMCCTELENTRTRSIHKLYNSNNNVKQQQHRKLDF